MDRLPYGKVQLYYLSFFLRKGTIFSQSSGKTDLRRLQTFQTNAREFF